MKLEIKRNNRNGGYCCDFEYDGEKYYASVCTTFEGWEECMIFPEGCWTEVYAKRGIEVTPENLKKCINEFISNLE